VKVGVFIEAILRIAVVWLSIGSRVAFAYPTSTTDLFPPAHSRASQALQVSWLHDRYYLNLKKSISDRKVRNPNASDRPPPRLPLPR